MAPNAGLNLIKKVYQILSGKELKEHQRYQRPPTPAYAKPTASKLMKDNELQRIPDKARQTFTAESILHVHNENLRIDRQEPGRLATGKAFTSTALKETRQEDTKQS